MHSLLGKRIAKQLKLLRYIPEHHIYELSVVWLSQTPASPTVFYLSEVFLYPYSLDSQLGAPETVIKGEDSNRGHSASTTDYLTNSELDQLHDHHSVANICSITKSQLTEKSIKSLDYDQLTGSEPLRGEVVKRNKDIVLHRQYYETKKKRKI